MNISSLINQEAYLSKFKVFKPQTLFEPSWDNLSKEACALCGNKLKYVHKRDVFICSSKKHGKPFLISKKKYESFRERISQ